MAESRGFSVGHQKVVLSCDLQGRLKGYAELVILPLSAELRTVFLNCSQCRVTNVSTADHPSLLYLHADPLTAKASNPTYKPTDPKDFRQSFPELKRKLYSAINQAEEGELGISLPDGLVKQSVMPEGLPEQSGAAFDPVALTIEYEVVNPKHGVRFVGGDNDSIIPHAYTTVSQSDGPRHWMPCLDTLWDRSSWELQLIVPRQLRFSAQEDLPTAPYESDEEDTTVIEQSLPILAIASGELMEQIVHPRDPNLVIFRYLQSSPTSAQHVGWAVGPFQIHDLAPPPVDDAIISEDGNAKLHAFCLPNFEAELEHTVAFVRQALDFFVAEYGSYPFGSFKLVFVDDSDATAGKALVHNTATMTTFPSDLLHPPTVIEPGFESRHTISYALASQWVGINIIQKTWADTWLINSLGFYLSGQFLKKLLGQNEYRFRLKKDVQKCCALDVDMPPLCEPRVDHPPEADVLPFVNLKGPLVLHILDQRLLKSGTMHGLSRVLPKIFLTAISGELKDGLLSTHQFLRFCRKISSTDLRVFSDQWIYGSGCPSFHITAQFSRKKMAVEMVFSQTCPSWDWTSSTPWQDSAQSNPVSLFEGQMTIRVHEADGTPYEHVLDIRELSKRHDVPFNTKYKRVRRQTKRYQARAEAMKAAAAGDAEAQEELALIDMSFGTQVWEEEDERDEWRVSDWTDADDEKMAHATYEWIRIDADFEWICTFHFDQPDFMWVSQLQRDRDVVAQLEAVQALTKLQTPVVASSLAKTVLVSNYFFRIRVEAIYALASMATASLDYLGLFYLFKIFESRFCNDPARPTRSAFGFTFQPKANDFSDFTEYFLRLAIVNSLSIVRDPEGNALPHVVKFLVNLLTYNDNSSNPYSDANYLCTVFKALSHIFVDVPATETSELFGPAESEEGKNPLLLAALDEVSRYMSMDRLVPSFRNSITVAGLEWKFKMMLAGLIPADLKPYFAYSREGNYAPVRMTSFDGLILLKGLKDQYLAHYIFSVLREDISPAVQSRIAETLVAGLPVLAAIDLLGSEGGDEQTFLVEEDEAPKPVTSNVFNSETATLGLRREYGKGEQMRENLLTVLLGPETNVRIRLALFKLCETLYRPKDESVPKLKFRLPASAAPAAAPAAQGDIPRIKLVSSGQRTKPGDPTVVPYDELENSAVVQPSALAGVPQPEAFNSRTNKSLPQPNKKKSKAPKEPHRSQASGMTTEDVQACRSLHAKMLKDPISAFFRQPVDPARDGAPGYFERVHRPMDLMTMNAKLQAGQYSNRDQFREDFEQIVRNTEMYNGMEHNITRAAKQMESKFRKQWNRIDATLRRKHERDLANGNGNVTVRPSGKGDAALSIDQTFSQPPTQQFKIKLAGAQHGNANEPPSKEALDRSATVPLPTAAAPPKTKLKLSFGPSKPQPPSAMAASPAERAMSPQRQIKKVKIAAPNAPLPPAVEPEAGPSTSVSSAEPNGISSSAPVLPTQDEVTVIESTRVQPTTASEAEAATSTQAMDEQLPPVQEPAPAEAAASFDAAPLPALGQMQPSPQLPVTASTTSAPPSAAPPAPAISAPPAPAIGAPSQPPPVKINIKKPMIKIKPAKPPPPPAVQPSAPKPPAPAPVAGPSRSPSLPASTQEPPVKKKETSDKAGEDESGVSTDPLDDHQRTKNILTHIWNQTEATWFRYPVDPVTSGCPTYYEEIKQPMDLNTIHNNYEAGQYSTWHDLNDDFELIVSNCHQFNPATSPPSQDADRLKLKWLQAWMQAKQGKTFKEPSKSKAPELSPYEKQKRAMQAGMKALCKTDQERGSIFATPVDPIRLNIPDYFDVIPREQARDLQTIKEKMDRDEFDSLDALEADLLLMTDNARKFNPVGTFVHTYATEFAKEIDKQMKAAKKKMSGANKRSGSALPGGSAKRMKMSI